MSAASTRAYTVSVEPAVLVGRVKLARNDAYGWDVVIATVTEEILVSENLIAEQLVSLAGRLVAVKGRLVKKPDGERSTFVAREFKVIERGNPFPPDDFGLGHGLRRVTAIEKLGPNRAR